MIVTITGVQNERIHSKNNCNHARRPDWGGDGGVDMSITVEQATVYRGGGRRFFTKRAAANNAARQTIKSRCGCDDDDHGIGYPGVTCPLHEPERYHKILRRLARLHLKGLQP